MNSLQREIEFYAFKIVILLPSLFLLFYVFPYLSSYINYYILVPIVLLPWAKVFLKREITVYVYPVFTIIFMLIVIYSLSYNLGIYSSSLLNNLLLSFDYQTLISIMMAIGIMILEEGIITRKMHRVVGSVIVSNLFLLEQYAAIYLMNNPTAIPLLNLGRIDYYQAFSAVAYLEVVSIYSFIVNGYEYLLPLATFNLPYRNVILTLFLISIVALLLFLYRTDTKWSSERGVSLGYSVISGAVVGAFAVLVLDRFNSYFYGGSFLLFFVIAVTVAAIWTSRRSYNERIEDSP